MQGFPRPERPTRGFEPRTPSLRVIRLTSKDPANRVDIVYPDGLEPAVNPHMHTPWEPRGTFGEPRHPPDRLASRESTLAHACEPYPRPLTDPSASRSSTYCGLLRAASNVATASAESSTNTALPHEQTLRTPHATSAERTRVEAGQQSITAWATTRSAGPLNPLTTAWGRILEPCLNGHAETRASGA
jgi:hypothetical protein